MIIFNPGLKVTRDQDQHSIYSHPDKGVLAIGWAPPGTEDATWGARYYTDQDNYQEGHAYYQWEGSSPESYDALVQWFLMPAATLYYLMARWAGFEQYEKPLPDYDQDDQDDQDDNDEPYYWDPYRRDEL